MKSFISVFILLALCSSALNAQTAHAGATIPVGSGFNAPEGVAVDGYGNVFVADIIHSQIIEIVAVNGAVSASSSVKAIGSGFNEPYGVAVDGYGNVFVAELGNSQVKEIVAVNGAVSASSTVNAIGSDFSYPTGVAVDGYGNVFVADQGHSQVREIVAVNGAVSASSSVNVIGSDFKYPTGVAVDGNGNVFVADTSNHQVKEIVAVNGAVSASSTVNVIGSGFTLPEGVAVDGYGNVFVADSQGLNSALEIVAVNGVVSATSTVRPVGTGYSRPAGVAVDSSGNVFVANSGGSDVLETLSGTQKFPTTPVGTPSAPLTVYFTFDSAGSLAATPYVVLTQGALNLDFKAASTQLSTVCTGGQTYNPGDSCTVNVTFTPTKPYQRIGAVQLMGAGGSPIATFNVHGTGNGPQIIFPSNSAVTTLPGSAFYVPAGVAVDGSGNVFVADSENGDVKEIAAVNGTVPANASVITVGSGFDSPRALAVDASGNVFVADPNINAVFEIVAVNGVVSGSSNVIGVGSGFSDPRGVAVDGSGNVFVADTGNNAVKEIVAVNGVVSGSSNVITVGSGFNSPRGLAVDASGNVFVGNANNNPIYEIVAVNGVVSGSSSVITVGSGFSVPLGVAVDGSGNVFVADRSNNAVYEIVAVNGVVSGSSTVITLGSGFPSPNGVAVDASGNVFVADSGYYAIQEIDRADPPSLTFASSAVGVASSDSPQLATVQNSGNATLSGTLSVGTNFNQVAGSGNPADCSAAFSLTPGQECNLSISFTPTTVGPLTGSATFTDNALNATPSVSQVIQLAGTGLQATQSITFNNPGVQVVGVPLTLTATATSGLAVSYLSTTQTVCTISSATVTFLAPGNCSLTASQLGNANYSAATPITRQFTVSATPIGPSATNNGVFPGTNVGVTSAATSVTFAFYESETLAATPYVVLTQGALNLDFKAASGQLSTVCTGGQTYNPGDSCTVNVTFTPTKPYQRIGAVQLMGSGGMPIATFNLVGTGVGPQLIFPSNSTLSSLNSTFNNPEGVAVDGSGNIFVSDQGNHAIEKIVAGTSQAITLVSGLYGVRSLAVDGSGNVFFADEGNANVQEIVAVNGVVSANSQVITVASGFNSPRGVAVDGGGNVFVADFNSAVYEVVATNGVVSNSSNIIQLATNFNFNRAQSVAVDAGGNVFVADTYSNAVVEIVAENGAVSATSQVITLASNFSFSYPSGVAVDGSGNVYVADTSHNAVVEIVAVNGAVSSSSTAVSLGNGYNSPFALAVDASGNVFVVNQNSNSLTELDRSDPPSLTFANTNVNSTSSDSPQSVTVENSGNANLTGTLNVGTNFTQVAGSGTPADCSASFSLTPSQECNLSISFKPTISGPVTGSASFTDNAPASPQSVSLSGTGVALTQTIQNFGTISTQTVGTPLTLTATATSGLAVSYQSSTLTVCTVSGSSVAFVSPGQCSITASQGGNNVYSAAQSITQQFTVNANIPTISNLQAVSVGGNSEVITWNTDQPSSSQVTYGATTTPLDSNLVTFHSVTLTGLVQNTAYNYSVSSTNATNGTATSPSGSFTTTPYVGYVAFWGVNNSGVTISWSTDFAATTFVAYGTTTALGQTSPVQSALSNGHGVVLTGLNPGTTYYFRAESTDGNGHTGASTLYTFTTTGQPASPAPVISNVSVTNITTTGATITWTTDQAATTQVNYGTSTSYGSSSSLNSNLVTSHSVTLTGLTPGTLYDYDVVSTNSSGTSSGMSTNYTFTTTAIIGTPPVISNIQTAVTSTTATITWTTDQAANSAISGTVSKSPDSNYVTSHSVTLTGLTPGTLYNFSVVSTNAGGLTTTSPTSSFTTTAANATAPFVGYVAFWGVNNSGVTISWSTDLAANTQLNYGTTPSLGTLTPLQATLTNSHGVVLTGLASGTTYYFVAQSTGANGATGYSTTYSFTTTGSPSAPAPNISNIQTSVTSTTATITWSTDEAASSQVNYGVTTTYSASSTLNTTLSTAHSVTLTGLMPGTTYDFDVMSANINGTSSTSSNSTFQTTGTAPGPVISSVAASSITSGSALITWTTDQASTSVVNYGQTVSSATLVTSHSVALSGLTPNTLYSFTVTSVNAGSVSTTSSSYTFTTSAASAAGPVISYVAYWGITSSGITISWSTNVPSNTSVAYGTTNALTSVTPVQSALSNSHGVTLTGLQPGTLYYFQAQSADVNGNTGTSTVYSFTTLAGGTPVISNVLVTPGSGNTASISWTTSAPTYSYVQYGPSSGNYNRYSPQSSLTASPNVSLGYVPSGTVYYQLVSTDANGDQVVSAEAMFIEP